MNVACKKASIKKVSVNVSCKKASTSKVSSSVACKKASTSNVSIGVNIASTSAQACCSGENSITFQATSPVLAPDPPLVNRKLVGDVSTASYHTV